MTNRPPPAWLTSCMTGIGLMRDTDKLSRFECELRDELLDLLGDGAGGYGPGAGSRQSLHLLRALRATAESGVSLLRCQRAELGLLLLWRLLDTPQTWSAATMPAPVVAGHHLDELRGAKGIQGAERAVADELASAEVGEKPSRALAAYLALPPVAAG